MKKDLSLNEILDKIEDHNVKDLSFAPKRHHENVEAELQEIVDGVAIGEPAGYTISIVEEHFIKQGENIAKVMEERARFHEKRAADYIKLAAEARDSAAKQAKAAAKHEERMKKLQDIVVEQQNDGG